MSKKALWVAVGIVLVALIYVLFFSGNKSANPETEVQTQTENKKMDTSTNQSSESGKLIVEDIKVGTGREAKSGDTVVMQYKGTLTDGTKFDSSYDRNEPFTTQIGVGQVIKGWDEGVPGMKVGGMRKLIIPADLAYGDRAVGSIPANSTLVFEVELLDIK